MKKQNQASLMPSAMIAVNKSRLKVYNNAGNVPTYYLQKGQEFQIELFNPTQDVVLAKITLNSKLISQGGLVLKPGERVFLDRYLDVAKKFLFDTYEVSDTEEVRAAIESNGDIKVEFYREQKPLIIPPLVFPPSWNSPTWTTNLGNYNIGTDPQFLSGANSGLGSGYYNNCSNVTNISSSNYSFTSSIGTTGGANSCFVGGGALSTPAESTYKSIETGRVEEGSKSNQEFNYVNKSFEYYAFCTVEYKLLPVSQKVSTTEDLNVRRYCTQCGKKQSAGDNFCAGCGKKQ